MKKLEPIKFRRKIRKSGGSAAIVIPPEILDALKWKVGDEVEIYAENQKIIVSKTRMT